MITRLTAALERVARSEGSTRPVALMRILLVLVAWSRWAEEIAPYTDHTGSRLALAVAFYVTTSWMLIGWWSRTATACAAAVLLVAVHGFGEIWSFHHTTLLSNAFVLLALTPNGASLSIDRWLAVRAAEREDRAPPPERGPQWATTLIAVQVSTVYFWSAADKSSAVFLSGTRLQQIFVHFYASSDWAPPAAVELAFAAAAISVVVMEYMLAFGLWIPRWRRVLLPLGLVLHGLFYALIPVLTFSVTMWTLYLAFLDPDPVHRAIDRLLGHGRGATGSAPP